MGINAEYMGKTQKEILESKKSPVDLKFTSIPLSSDERSLSSHISGRDTFFYDAVETLTDTPNPSTKVQDQYPNDQSNNNSLIKTEKLKNKTSQKELFIQGDLDQNSNKNKTNIPDDVVTPYDVVETIHAIKSYEVSSSARIREPKRTNTETLSSLQNTEKYQRALHLRRRLSCPLKVTSTITEIDLTNEQQTRSKSDTVILKSVKLEVKDQRRSSCPSSSQEFCKSLSQISHNPPINNIAVMKSDSLIIDSKNVSYKPPRSPKGNETTRKKFNNVENINPLSIKDNEIPSNLEFDTNNDNIISQTQLTIKSDTTKNESFSPLLTDKSQLIQKEFDEATSLLVSQINDASLINTTLSLGKKTP